MKTKEDIRQFLLDCYREYTEDNYSYTCSTLTLDDKLCVAFGWSGGFGEEDRDDVFQDEEEKDYALCAGIKVYTSDDLGTDFDYFNFPHYKDGTVLDIECTITEEEVQDNFKNLSSYFFDEYEKIKDLPINSDGLILSDKKLESLKEEDTIEEEPVKEDEKAEEIKAEEKPVEDIKEPAEGEEGVTFPETVEITINEENTPSIAEKDVKEIKNICDDNTDYTVEKDFLSQDIRNYLMNQNGCDTDAFDYDYKDDKIIVTNIVWTESTK